MSDTTTGETTKAEVERSACVGHGRCYMAAPDIFDCDDEGFAIVVGEAGTEAQKSDLARAVSNCPEQAITTSD